MPQLGQYKWILDTVFYLYNSKDDAERGKGYGGTGFLIAVKSEKVPGYYHVHGVTNWHVACQQGASVIRTNLKDGSPDVYEFDPSEWFFRPNSHDIAISPPLPLDASRHKASALGTESLVTADDEARHDIGPAEDVFMVGRFLDYDGAETNVPACRFGNISIANAAIKQQTGFAGRSIVIDMHSRTGFSGSPVFIYRNPGSTFAPMMDLVLSWHYLKVLGIHWGQFPEMWQLKEGVVAESASSQSSLITDGKYVEGLSGMTCVIPSSAILDLLADPQMVAARNADEIGLAADRIARGLKPYPTLAQSEYPEGGEVTIGGGDY